MFYDHSKHRHATSTLANEQFVSTFYHLCDERLFCVSEYYTTLQFCDFFWSFASISCVATLCGGAPKRMFVVF